MSCSTMALASGDQRVRPARADEVDAIRRIIVSAYGLTEESERWGYIQKMTQAWQSFLVLERKGEPVGVTRVSTGVSDRG